MNNGYVSQETLVFVINLLIPDSVSPILMREKVICKIFVYRENYYFDIIQKKYFMTDLTRRVAENRYFLELNLNDKEKTDFAAWSA
jgi:hypothetical protein